MKLVKVAQEFGTRLTNRSHLQGDGKNTAEEFRKKYFTWHFRKDSWDMLNLALSCETEDLGEFNEGVNEGNQEIIQELEITFDFDGVKALTPSFANEAFRYFLQYTTKDTFLKVVKFINISDVKLEIIMRELD